MSFMARLPDQINYAAFVVCWKSVSDLGGGQSAPMPNWSWLVEQLNNDESVEADFPSQRTRSLLGDRQRDLKVLKVA